MNSLVKENNDMISLGTSAAKGTPILVKWERDKNYVLFVTVSCLNKTTIIRIGG